MLIIENQLKTLQRDYDSAVNNLNQLEIERDNAVFEIKKLKLIVTDVEHTYNSKESQQKSNIKRLCDKLNHYTLSVNERKMVESILNCTFDGTEPTSERSSNPHLPLKHKHEGNNNIRHKYQNPIIVSNLNSPIKAGISSSFFNNSSSYSNTNASTFIHSTNKENSSIPRVNEFIQNKWSMIENEHDQNNKYRDRLNMGQNDKGMNNTSVSSRDGNYIQIPLNNSNLNILNSNHVQHSQNRSQQRDRSNQRGDRNNFRDENGLDREQSQYRDNFYVDNIDKSPIRSSSRRHKRNVGQIYSSKKHDQFIDHHVR